MDITLEMQINLFIFLYLFICFFWSTSNAFHIDQVLKNYLGDFVRYIGLWHQWLMYTSPYKVNHSMLAKVTFENGDINVIKVWDPDIKLKFLEISKYSRLQKIIENMITEDASFGIRKFFAHFLYLEYSRADNRIVLVELIQENEAIPDFFQKNNLNLSNHLSTNVLYTYRIPDDTITRSHTVME